MFDHSMTNRRFGCEPIVRTLTFPLPRMKRSSKNGAISEAGSDDEGSAAFWYEGRVTPSRLIQPLADTAIFEPAANVLSKSVNVNGRSASEDPSSESVKPSGVPPALEVMST